MIKKIDIIKLYKNSGIKKGDNIFCHSDLTRFSNINFPVNQLCKTILKSIKKQIGNSGTLAVPVFTYSFCKNEVFDPNKIKSNTGAFSNYVLNLPESRVYEDPNLAIAIIGKNKNFLAKNPQINSYGDKSFFDKFFKLNGKICNLNLDITSTFIHYFEKKLNVPYRYDKEFIGLKKKNSIFLKKKSILFIRYLINSTKQDLKQFIKKTDYKVTRNKINNCFTNCISLFDYYRIIKLNYKKNKNFLIKGKFNKNDIKALR